MIKSQIENSETGDTAKVTEFGQLVVGALSYDLTEFKSLSVINTAYNFYTPKANKQFVITGLLAFATKGVADTTDTIITIYESDEDNSITETKTLLSFGMGKLTVLPLTPLNILTSEAKFINAKTDDATINLTIMGYYIPI